MAVGQKKLEIEDSRAVQGMAALGCGIASTGGTCGVIVGAVLCLGMVYGKETPQHKDDPAMWKAGKSFHKRFLRDVTQGKVNCGEITRVDWTDKEQIKSFVKGEGRVRCAGYTGSGARILGEVIERYVRG
ncbi:MAG: C-GCAxxG-C-C family protein [Desulfohalobiaceae bacterium]